MMILEGAGTSHPCGLAVEGPVTTENECVARYSRLRQSEAGFARGNSSCALARHVFTERPPENLRQPLNREPRRSAQPAV